MNWLTKITKRNLYLIFTNWSQDNNEIICYESYQYVINYNKMMYLEYKYHQRNQCLIIDYLIMHTPECKTLTIKETNPFDWKILI